jgi:hypothetical protein
MVQHAGGVILAPYLQQIPFYLRARLSVVGARELSRLRPRGLDQNRHDSPHAAKARLSILRQVLRDYVLG